MMVHERLFRLFELTMGLWLVTKGIPAVATGPESFRGPADAVK